MNNKYRLALNLISGLILFGIFIYNTNKPMNPHDTYCSRERSANQIAFNGIVTNKHIDRLNHGAKTFVVNENSYYFIQDKNRFYDVIQIGDSIVKMKNSLAVDIYTNGFKRQEHLDFGCDPKQVSLGFGCKTK